MCGRFTLTKDEDIIEYRFSRKAAEKIMPNHNIAPNSKVHVITQSEKEMITTLNWGWNIEIEKQRKFLINARIETVFDKSIFTNGISKNRCLIIADGYYEWKTKAYGKQPYFIQLNSKELFSFAGFVNPINKSFVILTTTSVGNLKSIHHRTPVIVPQQYEEDWLNSAFVKSDILSLMNNSEKDLCYYPVSMEVNNVAINNSSLIFPISEQAELFD